MSTSVVYGHASAITVVYFTEEVPASDDLRLAAAVVWRGTPRRPPGGLRGLLRKLRFRLGPLGLGLHFRWSEPWGGAATGDGDQLTLYRARQGVVRVLGRNYPAPRDGRTLVLLVDEGAGRRPAIRIRLVTVPVQPRDRVEQDGSHALWDSALKSDPEVRTFMADWPDDAKTEG
jgi:hypothetical protein